MKIVVFGANGRVGRLVVENALTRGYSVVAAIHSSNPFQPHELLSVVKVDALDPQSIATVISKGTDVIISCLGSWGTDSKNILTVGMEEIIPAMDDSGVSRIISLTGSAALLPDEDVSLLDKLNRRALQFIAGDILRDGEQHLRLLRDSQLDWTVIRSPIMTGFGRTDYSLTVDSPKPWQTIHRHAVAQSMIDQITATDFFHSAPFIKR